MNAILFIVLPRIGNFLVLGAIPHSGGALSRAHFAVERRTSNNEQRTYNVQPQEQLWRGGEDFKVSKGGDLRCLVSGVARNQALRGARGARRRARY
eukprot:scaffold36120_cov169-Isochrysis_galbana.AAC.5